MSTEWMGRYRPLIAALVRHTNVANTGNVEKDDFGDGILLTPIAWQVLEYSIEHRDNTFSMTDIARTLGIPQSTFSKQVKDLVAYGFIDKFMATNNLKNVIVRPTEKGLNFYLRYNSSRNRGLFDDFFKVLDRISDEDIERFTAAINTLTDTLPPANRQKAVKLVKKN